MEKTKTAFKSPWLIFVAIAILLGGVLWRVIDLYRSSIASYRLNYILESNDNLLRVDAVRNKIYFAPKEVSVPVDGKITDLNFIDWLIVKKTFLFGKTENQNTLQVFWEEKILQEKARVEVLNAQAAAGSANDLAQVLANIGVDVINVSNSDQVVEGCVIQSDNPKSYTTVRISKAYGCKVEEKPSGQRASITVLLHSLPGRE